VTSFPKTAFITPSNGNFVEPRFFPINDPCSRSICEEPDRKRKNTTTGKQERERRGWEKEERVRGQSLEVMGIGRNSVGNPWRQTH